MKQFAPLLFVLMLPVSALAEAVAVVSGEHEGYTRLVLEISADREWNLITKRTFAKLVFPAQNLEFEDTEVFDRIPRTRLVSAVTEQREDAAVYTMELGCDCEVSAFSYLDAYIVVDISDPPETSISAPPARHFAPVLSAAVMPDGNGRPPERVSWKSPQAPRYASSPHRVNFPAQTQSAGFLSTQTPGAPPDTSHTDVGQASPIVESDMDLELQMAVDVARNSLLQQLTLAADQGLLDLNGPIPEILQAVEMVPEIEPEEVVRVTPEVFENLENENQVVIQTAITRDALAARGGSELQNDNCPRPKDLDVTSWGTGGDFFEELSSARHGLLKEFDEPDFNEVERLIRTYLRYGFGAEAITYLKETDQHIAQKSLLLDLATIVDGQPARPDGPLSQAISCDGIAGLWAIVGAYPNVDMPIGDEATIIEAFAALPPDIRRILGPRLASAILDRGLDAFARQISDVLERAPGDHGGEHELVTGNLKQIEGSLSGAEETYRSLAEENSQMATEALIELAEFKLRQSESPSEHLLLDLGSAAKTLRGTQKGGELRRLEALWLANLGREAEAINMLIAESETDPVNAEMFSQTAEEILSTLSLSAKHVSNYAEIVDSYIEYIPKSADADKLRAEIAKQLLLFGLIDYSIEVLKPSLRRSKPDAILLAAEANMLAKRPDVALTLLRDAVGDVARMLRVEAHLAIGNFDEALGELDQLEDAAGAIVPMHWFGGDWASEARSNSAAAEIKERYLYSNSEDAGGAHDPFEDIIGLDKTDTITLSAIQELLVYSQSASQELKDVLMHQ